jgi:Domain of unknown function (DUF2027)
MNVKIGDTVRFLNDVGGGRITSILSNDVVNVETEDGFEVPTRVNNLVVVNRPDHYESGNSSSSVAQPKPQPAAEKRVTPPAEPWFSDKNQVAGKDEAELLFILVPEQASNPTAGNLSMYLINNCNHTLLFRFAQKTKYNFETMVSGSASPNSKVYLGLIKSDMFNDLPAYYFQWLHFQKRSKELEAFQQKEIAISAVKFYKPNTFVATKFFKVPVLVFQLHENRLKAELEKLTTHDFQKAVAHKEPQQKAVELLLPNTDLVEIDLHIQELLDNYSNLTNTEMLTVQMDKFREEMSKAISLGIKRIVFIHGVGNGTLKTALRLELERKYSKYPSQDASFREYGYGATMVILKK